MRFLYLRWPASLEIISAKCDLLRDRIHPNSRPPRRLDFRVWRAIFYRKETFMLDVLMVATALVFFALSVGYAYACDRL
jgi:hypothetical protein